MKKVINIISLSLSQIPQKTQNNLSQSSLRDLQLATRAIPQRKNRKKICEICEICERIKKSIIFARN